MALQPLWSPLMLWQLSMEEREFPHPADLTERGWLGKKQHQPCRWKQTSLERLGKLSVEIQPSRASRRHRLRLSPSHGWRRSILWAEASVRLSLLVATLNHELRSPLLQVGPLKAVHLAAEMMCFCLYHSRMVTQLRAQLSVVETASAPSAALMCWQQTWQPHCGGEPAHPPVRPFSAHGPPLQSRSFCPLFVGHGLQACGDCRRPTTGIAVGPL
mmetsp:Transcript_35388/g.80988  ORF Transcript_35388/g.80988 Transcript_35388/m.80988 type:complete len:215 (-) Transcript_35388:1309-1953(-)